MVGCDVNRESFTLTITSTTGGSVVEPGEGTFTYYAGTEVNLEAEADEGYQFVNWYEGLGHIADVRAAATTIVMNNDYSIHANFAIPTLVWDWYDLNSVENDQGGVYILMNNLNCTTPGYEELAGPTSNGGKGWQPIGSSNETKSEMFHGTFDGQGYNISDIFINRPHEYNVGLFHWISSGGGIKNLGVVNATVTGYEWVGALVGFSHGTVSNCHSVSSVNGTQCVGGLVAYNSGTVSNSYSTGSVTGAKYIGGLVGKNSDNVNDSYSTGIVTGHSYVGGLVGANYEANVSYSYSTGSVTGHSYVGGLVGDYCVGTISNCYSSSSVTGDWHVGGLVGSGQEYGEAGSTISNSYSTGTVTGNLSVGGLVGWNYGCTVSNSFWDTATSGQATSAGGTGKTTAQMKNIATFSGAGWDIIEVGGSIDRNPAYIWNIVDTETYPFLNWQP